MKKKKKKSAISTSSQSIISSLRVNVSIIQSDAEQGSVDLADFHIYSTVFHADSRGAIRFSKIDYCSGLR